MKILIAGEVTGRLRDAFRLRGHEAWSVDLLDIEDIPHDLALGQEFPHYHFVGDMRWFLPGSGTAMPTDWDMIIAHPPCQYMANCGVRWLNPKKGPYNMDRHVKMVEGTELFNDLLRCKIPRKAIENSIMHPFARKLIDRNYDHTTQPSMFGDRETKRACWWLDNVPPLQETNVVSDDIVGRAWRMAPSKWRWLYRSILPPGMVNAIADQWGSL